MCGTAQNDDKILPLDKSAKIAFIGEFADKPRYQGGGSSHINSFKVTSALEAVKGMDNITYAQASSPTVTKLLTSFSMKLWSLPRTVMLPLSSQVCPKALSLRALTESI